jgi:hypothetical protein
VRALVRPDPPGAVLLDAHAREQAVARAALPVGAGVVLLERPERRLRVLDDDAFGAPCPERRGGVLVRVAAGGILRQVDRDGVVGRAREQLGALLGVDHVVRRGRDAREPTGAIEVVVERVQGRDVGHAAADARASAAAAIRAASLPSRASGGPRSPP